MAQELFGYDGIMSNYDNYLDLESLGNAFDWVQKDAVENLISKKRISRVTGTALTSAAEVGRAPVVFEATEHICGVVGRDVPVIGVLNSPVTLVRMLLGSLFESFAAHREELKKPLGDTQGIVLNLIKAYCALRVDVVWLIEEDWTGMTREDIRWIKPIYETFWNVTRYYDVKTILGFHDYDTIDIDKCFALGSDGVFFGGSKSKQMSPLLLAERAERSGVCVGLACPYPAGQEGGQLLDDLVRSACDIGKGVFLSTPFEVTLDTPVEWINSIMDRIKD